MTEKVKDPIQAEFAALPLEEKISQLMKMEAVTLTETFNYVVDSATKAFEKAGDTINDFGEKAKKAAESAASSTSTPPKVSTAKPKSSGAKKPSATRKPKG